jgi:flagellar hook-associated protein 2
MPGIQLSGLSSGLDTASIIQALMAAESLPKTQLTYRQAAQQARQSALQQVETKLKTLHQASDDLSSVLTWLPKQTATSADDSKVSATLSSGAAPGGYSITVASLATSTQRTYTYSAQASDTSVTINGVTVTIPANSNVDAAASAINSTQNTNVIAINVGGSLVLASTATGSTSDFSAAGATLAEQTARAHVGTDAQFSLDGGATTQTSSTNTIDASTVDPATGQPLTDFPAGLKLTLKAATSGTGITVSTPAVDGDAVKSKLTAFVSAYNDAISFINSKTSDKPVANPKSTSDAAKGALYGDLTLENVVDNLRRTVGAPLNIAGNPSTMQTLADIGVSTGATTGGAAFSQDAVAGKLVLDATKLTSAMSSDPLSVQRLLGGLSGASGFSQSFGAQLDPYTQAGGVLDSTLSQISTNLSDISSQLSDWDARLQLRQTALQKQFTNMETALQKAKSQGSYLMSQLGLSTTTTSTTG